MAITIRGPKPGTPVKRNIVSLLGGMIIAIGCFVLWLLVVSDVAVLTWPWAVGGAGLATAVGTWIWLADL